MEKRVLRGFNKTADKKRSLRDNRFKAEGKRPEEKCSLKNSSRYIVANIGKGGIILEHPYFIYEKGYDVTPSILESSLFPNILHHDASNMFNFQGSQTPMESSAAIKSDLSRMSTLASYSFIAFGTSGRSSFISRITGGNKKENELIDSAEGLILEQPIFSLKNTCTSIQDLLEEEIEDDLAPSMFRLRIDPPPKEKKLNTKFTVNLRETETIFLLKIPSTADLLESKEGKLIYESNSMYENTVQTTKAISQTATQTEGVFHKNRKLYIPRNKRANCSTFVSVWEMYDTYKALISSAVSIKTEELGRVTFIDHDDTEIAEYNINFKYSRSNFDIRLLVNLMIMERLILNNSYRENHLTYNGMMVQDPLSLEVTYDYSLAHLWTFHSNIVAKRAVTSMSWNTANSNILAVGYGKFYYKDQCNGLVCIWNVKNPVQPERHYEFEHPVTFLTFHPKKRQILAVTFYNGSVILIDIISWVLLIKATNEHYPLYHPIWQARWFHSETKGRSPILITGGKNGKVYRYKKNKFFISKKIMWLGKVHGRIQGVEQPRPCYGKKTLTSTSVQVLIPHPSNTLVYLAGTSDGCVFICSILSKYDHLDVFQAHTGPVYNIQFNPFCKKVFLTCGADWCIRLWVEEVYVPLITLQNAMQPVEYAVWSPLHSTIILSVTDTRVEIWDLRRSISTPKSIMATPSASFNTMLRFTANGYNVCIGDLEGNVHVMAMSGMPFSPNYQEDVLLQTLMVALVTRPELIIKLKKIFRQFSDVKTEVLQTKMDRKLQRLIASAKSMTYSTTS